MLIKCCGNLDFVVVTSRYRDLAVCITCGTVFQDFEVAPEDRHWFSFTYKETVRCAV